MSKHYSVLAGLVVYCLMGVAVAAAAWAARPAPSAAEQAPPLSLESNLTLGVEDGDEKPMFSAPVLFNCAKDERIFILNPHKYEVSVFKDRKLERVIEGRNDEFEPLQKMGRGFISTAAKIVSSGDFVFVALQKLDPRANKTADVFQAGKQVGSVDLPGTPYITDAQGMIYIAEEEGFPRVVRYAVTWKIPN